MDRPYIAAILLSICGSVFGQGAYDLPPPPPSRGDGEGGPAVAFSPGLGLPARPSFDRKLVSRIELTHGVMATMAFAAFFPLGAIAIRAVPGRLALVVHLGLQFLAYAFFTAAVGMGIWMSQTLEPLGADFVSSPPVLFLTRELTRLHKWNHHHIIIGLTVFGLLAVQALLGIIHHVVYRRKGRRQIWSYAHVWIGRILITLGIINGGLGMQLARVSRAGKIAYGVCAGTIWVVWMIIAVASDFKKTGKADDGPKVEKRVKIDDEQKVEKRDRASDTPELST